MLPPVFQRNTSEQVNQHTALAHLRQGYADGHTPLMQPKWQSLVAAMPADGAAQPGPTPDGADDAAAAAKSEKKAQRPRSLAEWCEAGSWTAPAVGGERRPLPRYDHAVAGVGMKMFVVGGNNGEGGLSGPPAAECLESQTLITGHVGATGNSCYISLSL